jgi:hypothetical protein
MMRRPFMSVGLLWLILPLVGCGTSSTTSVAVKGRIVNNGAPLTVKGQQVGVGRVELHLIPTPGSGGTARVTLVQPDGKFSFDQAGGFTAGKYKLAVYAWEPAPDPSKAPGGLIDRLEGAFSKDSTPIEREITPGKDLGEIDLATFPKTPSTEPAKL